MSIVLFLVILAVLIFVHELGHFIFAKLSGIRVDEFAIGFPPRIFKWKYGETTYAINLIPFGGFVKIFGENPNEDSLNGSDNSRSFIRKPRHIQAATLVAGIAFNIIFAWFLISGALIIGLPAPADYAGSRISEKTEVAIIEVLTASPAEKAGFKSGDRVLTVSTEGVVLDTVNAESVQSFIKENQDTDIAFSVKRGSEVVMLKARAADGLVDDRKAIGISLGDIRTLKLPLGAALIEGAKRTVMLTKETASGLYTFIKSAILGKASVKEVTGPIGIAGLVGEASDFGLAYLLNFTAFISINLAVLNLLPFPALDGGRLAVVLIEAVIRRPLNYTYVNAVNVIGFMLLMLLMVLVTYQDIIRLFGN